jgi:hypothetical protein
MVGQAMNVIDVLKGTGVGVASSGKSAVRYELLVLDKDGDDRKGIQGWVLPTFGMWGETLTLEMQDGTSVQFSYVHKDGTVEVQGGVVPKGT